MYEQTDMKFAKGYFHWFYLIQPAPFPEKMIMADPKRWLKSRFNRSPKRTLFIHKFSVLYRKHFHYWEILIY